MFLSYYMKKQLVNAACRDNKSIFREYNIYVTKIRKSCRSSFANIIKYNQRFFLIDCSHWIHHRNVNAAVIFTTIRMLLTCKWRTLQIKYQIWYFSSYSYLIQTGLLCLVFWPLKFTVRTKTNNIVPCFLTIEIHCSNKNK